MRILITGLSGFTGYYLKNELLKHGHEVIGLKSNVKDTASLNDEIRKIKPEALVHLAAISFVGHKNTAEFYETNLIGTLNLLKAIYKNAPNIKSIMIASSATIYGNNPKLDLSESDPVELNNDYAISKCAMENMTKLWFNKLPIFIVRPFNYTGALQRDTFIIPKIVKHFKDTSEYIELGNINVWREFNDVRMIAQIYRKLLYIAPSGNIINICSGKTHSLQEIIKICQEITNHFITIRINPEFVRENETKELKGNCKKLKSIIGDFNFLPIEKTLEWMLKYESNTKIKATKTTNIIT
jgi:GDP-6-deoxy-D-talose 4-dehydrogenase